MAARKTSPRAGTKKNGSARTKTSVKDLELKRGAHQIRGGTPAKKSGSATKFEVQDFGFGAENPTTHS